MLLRPAGGLQIYYVDAGVRGCIANAKHYHLVYHETSPQGRGCEEISRQGLTIATDRAAKDCIRVDPELWVETLRKSTMREQFHDNLVSWRDALAALIEMGQAEGLFDQRLDPQVSAAQFYDGLPGLVGERLGIT